MLDPCDDTTEALAIPNFSSFRIDRSHEVSGPSTTFRLHAVDHLRASSCKAYKLYPCSDAREVGVVEKSLQTSKVPLQHAPKPDTLDQNGLI